MFVRDHLLTFVERAAAAGLSLTWQQQVPVAPLVCSVQLMVSMRCVVALWCRRSCAPFARWCV